MPFFLPRPFSPRHLASLALLLAGCDLDPDPGSDAVEWRTDEYFDISADLDPIPGGGACEECVSDAVLTNIGNNTWRLDLCIDGRVKYVGSSLRTTDDILLRSLLATLTTPHDGDWSLVNGRDGVGLCNTLDSGACTFTDLNLGASSVALSIEFTSNQNEPAPHLLQFVPPDALLGLGPASPAMRIPFRSPGDPLQCGEPDQLPNVAVPPQNAPGPLPPALAHITSGFAYGGVRSCSGVLITAEHVLTAAHCLPPTGTAWTEADSAPAPSHLRLLTTTGLLDTLMLSVEANIRHPDPARDLAIVRLEHPADLTKFQPIAVGALQPMKADCTLNGQGFGRSETSLGFGDWGHAKTISVRPADPEAPVHADFHPDDLGKLLLLENTEPDAPKLCRGDSGGPIIQQCNGQRKIVGIASARVFASKTSVRPNGTGIERLTNAFAFSYGNTCGEGKLVAYVATRMDADVLAWIAGVIGESSPPLFQSGHK